MLFGGDKKISISDANIIFDKGRHYILEPILFESETSSTMQIVDNKLKITCINTGTYAEPNVYGNCCMYIGDVKASNGHSDGGIVSNRIENQGAKSDLVLAINISQLQGEKYINFCVQGYGAMSYTAIKKMFLI